MEPIATAVVPQAVAVSANGGGVELDEVFEEDELDERYCELAMLCGQTSAGIVYRCTANRGLRSVGQTRRPRRCTSQHACVRSAESGTLAK